MGFKNFSTNQPGRLIACITLLLFHLVLDDPRASQNDDFQERVRVEIAQCFQVRYEGRRKILKVLNPGVAESNAFEVVLLPRDEEMPPGNSGKTVIRTPVKRYVSLSTTHLHSLQTLGVLDGLAGIARARDIGDEGLKKRLMEGSLKEVGLFQKSSLEILVDLEPEVIFIYGSGAPGEDLDYLKRLQIPVVLVSEFLESSPLGYAEWLKFFSLFFDRESVANEVFKKVRRHYRTLKQVALSQKIKPTVFANIPYGGTWFMPGGKSYFATILKDAGANYLWDMAPLSGSLKLSLESVIEKAAEARVWINPGEHATLGSLRDADPRFRIFSALSRGQVFNMNRKSLGGVSNDYFSVGLSNPHRLIKDLIQIFHPGLLPNHEPEWYHRLR